MAFFAHVKWTFNKEYSVEIFAASSWWALRSVLLEELVFRGAFLYMAIQRFGIKAACLLSAVAFGVYHWFSYGILGDISQMAMVFTTTGIWGFMFALAYAKTKSLYLPIGLHFGWNLVNIVIFSQGPLGNQLVIGTGWQKLGAVLSALFFLFQVIVVPLIAFWCIRHQALAEPSRSETINTDAAQI